MRTYFTDPSSESCDPSGGLQVDTLDPRDHFGTLGELVVASWLCGLYSSAKLHSDHGAHNEDHDLTWGSDAIEFLAINEVG